MKKWIRKSLVRKLNNFKGLTPANVHRVETTTITFLNDNRIVKICTIKDDEVILIPKKISNVMVSSRFFAIRDILKNFFNQKSM
ncbi:hypothetical protein [Fusobacterium mortiferum]|jgi:hypothetical protein|uniref:hypothetical protein n=1 Tax=Fusobacterium mortiferum TaxID=850 RepID=UPI001F26FB9A|nr:hypothetical protein [Fusobacterium mortiferum]MCF2699821.1 hypothetical protein [Fusobacterium mortiferum]